MGGHWIGDEPPASVGANRTLTSGAQECRRYNSDTVRSTIRIRSSRDHDGVDEFIAQVITQPQQVLHMVVSDRASQLYLDGEHPLIGALNDQVDLAVTTLGSEVTNPCFDILRIRPYIERDERLE